MGGGCEVKGYEKIEGGELSVSEEGKRSTGGGGIFYTQGKAYQKKEGHGRRIRPNWDAYVKVGERSKSECGHGARKKVRGARRGIRKRLSRE